MSFFRYFFPVIVWTGGIIYLLLIRIPSNLQKIHFEGLDKLVHFGLFGGLSFLAAWAFFNQKKSFKLKSLGNYLALGYAVWLAGFTELLQHYFFAYRSGDWLDFLADSVGAVLGIFAFEFFQKNILIKRV